MYVQLQLNSVISNMRYFLCLLLIYLLLVKLIRAEKCGYIFLTVNAVTGRLEFNWDFTVNCDNPPDSLSIVYEETDSRTILTSIYINGSFEGFELSNIKFERPPYPGNWNDSDENHILASVCYPYWIESRRNGVLIDSKCMKIEPAWMQQFGQLKIADMMIPGTHDSGAFTTSSFLAKYILTQEYDLWGQLVSGIRYFDIRTSVFGDVVWLSHGGIKCTTMTEELQKIAKFLKFSPKEVVILHMKAFEEPKRFTIRHHEIVLTLLQKVLGDHILPRDSFSNVYDVTVEDIWEHNRTLIVSYGNATIVEENKWLWNGLLHKWGDKQDVLGLYDYLNLVKSNHFHPPTPFCSLMAELTLDFDYIIHNLHKSLRNMADKVNPSLNIWLRKYNWSDVVNIVATDFFLGNDAISISIEANKRRLINIDNYKIETKR